jgi:peroxiredoxin
MGTPAYAVAFRACYRLPFRCLADTERAAYRAYGLPRGGLGAVAGPAIWAAGWKALLRHGVGRVVGDPYQLPGSFVIDTAGFIRHAHRATSSADWASNDELIVVLTTLRPE